MNIIPPGIPSDIERYFYNRKEELTKLKYLLKPLEDDVSNQILVNGYRGVGKSFLLMKLILDLPENFLTAYIDISKIYGIQRGDITEEKVLHSLLEEMGDSAQKKIPDKINHHVRNIISKIRNKKYDFREAGNVFGIAIPKIDDDYERLSHFVMEFPQKLMDKLDDKDGFVIIIDEFQFLGKLKNPEAFFWMFRSYTQNQDNVSYIFTGSTASSSDIIQKINGIKGAFGGRMVQFIVEPFTRATTQGYLEEMTELNFTEDGLECFYKYTRGFPAYINSFCNVMLKNGIYDEKLVSDTFYSKIDQIATLWMSIWATLNQREKYLITLLVEHGPQTWKDLSQRSDFSPNTISKYLNSLKNKGIVTHLDRKYRVDDHMLSAWLKYREEKDGFFPP